MIYDKLKIMIIYGIGGAVFLGLLWIMLRFAIPIILPFAIAYAVAYALRIGARALSSLTKMNENMLKGFILISVVLSISIFLWFGASVVIRKISEAISDVSEAITESGGIRKALESIALRIGSYFGGAEIGEAMTAFVSDLTSRISSAMAGIAASFVSALPSFAIGFAISIAALFYFTFGYEKATAAIKQLLPKKSRSKICSHIVSAINGFGRFIRAYSLIIVVTFAELFVGFLIMGIDHAFVLAAVISVVDFLPIIGVGGVLAPWAAVSFFMGNTYRAIGLIIIVAVIWAVRQPVESKLIGKGAGVHPIFALVAVYAGFRLAGVFGMIVAPVLLTAAAIIFREKALK